MPVFIPSSLEWDTENCRPEKQGYYHHGVKSTWTSLDHELSTSKELR
jgi:hypothetical protein